MTTRMISPDGGATHAYGDGDIARLEKLGWTVEKPITGPVLNGYVEPPELIELPVFDEPPEQVLKEALAESMRLDPPRRGRPPKAK